MTAAQTETRRRSTLRFEFLNLFVDFGITAAQLTPSAVAVWLVMFRHATPDGYTEVSINAVSESSGICRRTVMRALAELRSRAMLKTVKKGGINRGSSRYILFPKPQA